MKVYLFVLYINILGENASLERIILFLKINKGQFWWKMCNNSFTSLRKWSLGWIITFYTGCLKTNILLNTLKGLSLQQNWILSQYIYTYEYVSLYFEVIL